MFLFIHIIKRQKHCVCAFNKEDKTVIQEQLISYGVERSNLWNSCLPVCFSISPRITYELSNEFLILFSPSSCARVAQCPEKKITVTFRLDPFCRSREAASAII